MQPADVFGIVVRSIGLIIVLYGLWYGLFGIGQMAGVVTKSENPTGTYILTGIIFVFVGGAVIIGANSIVNAAYK
jgi:hypothetical protein